MDVYVEEIQRQLPMIILYVKYLQLVDQSFKEDVLGIHEKLPAYGNDDASIGALALVVLEHPLNNLPIHSNPKHSRQNGNPQEFKMPTRFIVFHF